MGISKLKTLIFFVICSFSLINCQNKKMEEKYKWNGNVCAPQEYPMQVYYGMIIADDYQYPFTDIVGIVNNGWGEDGGYLGGKDLPADLPHTLEFTWYSLVENKFYAGHWELDKERITKLFKEGFSVTSFDSLEKGTYDTFLVGLAPGGKITLWISGEGHQAEVGSFHGKEIKISKEEAYDKFKYVFEPGYRENMLKDKSNGGITDPMVYNKIKEEGYPDTKIYDDFEERFNWRPKIILPEKAVLNSRAFDMCNGEKEMTLKDNHDVVLPYQKRAVPYYFSLGWQETNGKKMNSEIVFTNTSGFIQKVNENATHTRFPLDFIRTEIYKLFRETLDKNLPIDMIIDVSSGKNVKISLEQDGKKYPVAKFDTYVE